MKEIPSLRAKVAAFVATLFLVTYPAVAFAACYEVTVDNEVNICVGGACVGIHWSTTQTICS